MYTKDILVKIFHVFFFRIFYYLLILAIGNMNLQSPFSALVIVPIVFLLYYAAKFPPTHWIMMMLNISGGFKQEDVDYT